MTKVLAPRSGAHAHLPLRTHTPPHRQSGAHRPAHQEDDPMNPRTQVHGGVRGAQDDREPGYTGQIGQEQDRPTATLGTGNSSPQCGQHGAAGRPGPVLSIPGRSAFGCRAAQLPVPCGSPATVRWAHSSWLMLLVQQAPSQSRDYCIRLGPKTTGNLLYRKDLVLLLSPYRTEGDVDDVSVVTCRVQGRTVVIDPIARREDGLRRCVAPARRVGGG